MRRFLAFAVAASVAALGLVSAQAAPARAAPAPLALGGCADTPVTLSDTAAIARTCASWDGVDLALWIEGSGLAQEFTAVGTANIDLFGFALTIEARAGMRAVPYGGWEAFVELTRPVALGPLAVPLQVAEDGTRVTLWMGTTTVASRSTAVRTDASNSVSLVFAGPDGPPRDAVVVPMALGALTPPPVPTPDIHPYAPPPASHAPQAPSAAARLVEAAHPATATATIAATTASTRVGSARAALGRY